MGIGDLYPLSQNPLKSAETFNTVTLSNVIKSITLTEEENHRLYTPWKFSLIIKLSNSCITHHILRSKLQQLWKILDHTPLIELGHDYYILKFSTPEDMNLSSTTGPGSSMDIIKQFRNGCPILTRRQRPLLLFPFGFDYHSFLRSIMTVFFSKRWETPLEPF